MPKLIDVTGQRFNYLTALRRVFNSGHAVGTYWECLCDCGMIRVIDSADLRTGHTKSCGCKKGELVVKAQIKHGYNRRSNVSKTFTAWADMHYRCKNTKLKSYKDYGGRGITVHKDWEIFENFLADMGESPKGSLLDRIDNNGNYCKENCRWATPKVSANNRRDNRLIEFNGLKLSAYDWARKTGINRSTIVVRLHKGWSVEKTLTTPGKYFHTYPSPIFSP